MFGGPSVDPVSCRTFILGKLGCRSDPPWDFAALRDSNGERRFPVGSGHSSPGSRNRERAIRYDKDRYRDRHLIENAFCRLKDFRPIATRYDRLAANFSQPSPTLTSSPSV